MNLTFLVLETHFKLACVHLLIYNRAKCKLPIRASIPGQWFSRNIQEPIRVLRFSLIAKIRSSSKSCALSVPIGNFTVLLREVEVAICTNEILSIEDRQALWPHCCGLKNYQSLLTGYIISMVVSVGDRYSRHLQNF